MSRDAVGSRGVWKYGSMDMCDRRHAVLCSALARPLVPRATLYSVLYSTWLCGDLQAAEQSFILPAAWRACPVLLPVAAFDG